jgi:hypothetical protein
MLWLNITSIISEMSLTLQESILEYFPYFSELTFFSKKTIFMSCVTATFWYNINSKNEQNEERRKTAIASE